MDDLKLASLMHLEDPCVVFEGVRTDSDGVLFYTYSVGGFLHGQKINPSTVEGDLIIVHAKNRAEADDIAGNGLMDSIELMRAEGIDSSSNAGIIANVEARNLQ